MMLMLLLLLMVLLLLHLIGVARQRAESSARDRKHLTQASDRNEMQCDQSQKSIQQPHLAYEQLSN
jgi:hypothetical protein